MFGRESATAEFLERKRPVVVRVPNTSVVRLVRVRVGHDEQPRARGPRARRELLYHVHFGGAAGVSGSQVSDEDMKRLSPIGVQRRQHQVAVEVLFVDIFAVRLSECGRARFHSTLIFHAKKGFHGGGNGILAHFSMSADY